MDTTSSQLGDSIELISPFSSPSQSPQKTFLQQDPVFLESVAFEHQFMIQFIFKELEPDLQIVLDSNFRRRLVQKNVVATPTQLLGILSQVQELKHENLLKMLLVEKEEDRVNVHYEYVEGFDYFTRRIRTDLRRFDNEKKIKLYLRQLLQCVQYIHESGLVHMGIHIGALFRQENDQEPKVKLGSLHMMQPEGSAISEAHRIRLASMYSKLPQDTECTAKFDVYCCGVLAYELITCTLPDNTRDLNQTILRKGASNRLTKIIMQMIEEDPAKRPGVNQILQEKYFTEIE